MSWQSSIEHWVHDACVAEVGAEKPGNVSLSQRFSDIDSDAFVRSAEAIAPQIARVAESTVGVVVLSSIKATRRVVDSNTNLGIVLLLAPLAAVPEGVSLRDGIHDVLHALTVDDATHVFEAIRIAQPGGLGEVQSEDVTQKPSMDLCSCMRLAADRDLIAAQYANGFQDVLNFGIEHLQRTSTWTDNMQARRLAWVALNMMATNGDSLIRRKCGKRVSDEVASRARNVLDAGWPQNPNAVSVYSEFDQYLRLDGNQLNPGTTADMIAAILFAGLRERIIESSDHGRTFRFVDRG